MDRYGNTSAASIPVALNELAESGQLPEGRPLACIGFGGGLTWGGAVMVYQPLSLASARQPFPFWHERATSPDRGSLS